MFWCPREAQPDRNAFLCECAAIVAPHGFAANSRPVPLNLFVAFCCVLLAPFDQDFDQGHAVANFTKRGKRWRVRLLVNGVQRSGTFATKAEAAAWAVQVEAELTGARLPDRTLAQAIERYAESVATEHKGERWERIRLASWLSLPMARRPIASITATDIAEWRDASLAKPTRTGKKRAPATVAREFNLLRSVFEIARREWRWINDNPMADVRRPSAGAVREQRISDDEAGRICLALGFDGSPPVNQRQRIAVMFLLALETAMRSGEMEQMCWTDVHLAERYVRLPVTKNGESRDVPLSLRAVELLQLLPRESASVFNVSAGSRDAEFRRARDKAGCGHITFHDARHEATTRLARKLDVLDLSRVTGHRDLKTLRRYYNPTASEIAQRLG